MRILEMILPRLEAMSQMASDRSVVRDAKKLAELREDYRYMASVSMSLIPALERQLVDLPGPIPAGAPVEDKISFQMAIIRQTNRLHRAVEADVLARQAGRDGLPRAVSLRAELAKSSRPIGPVWAGVGDGSDRS